MPAACISVSSVGTGIAYVGGMTDAINTAIISSGLFTVALHIAAIIGAL